MPQILFNGDPDLRIGFAWAAAMLDQGGYGHPWHNMFHNGAMTEADIDFAIEAADGALAHVREQRAGVLPHPRLMELLGGN